MVKMKTKMRKERVLVDYDDYDDDVVVVVVVVVSQSERTASYNLVLCTVVCAVLSEIKSGRSASCSPLLSSPPASGIWHLASAI
jgi:hypothetical protein